MKKSDAQILFLLIEAFENAEAKMENVYDKKDYDSFVKIKQYVLEVQRRIAEVTK
jgi:hypothetical protein